MLVVVVETLVVVVGMLVVVVEKTGCCARKLLNTGCCSWITCCAGATTGAGAGAGVGRGWDFGRTIGSGLGLAAGRLRLMTVTLRPLFSMKVLAGARLPDRILSFKIGCCLDTGLGLGVGAKACCGGEVTGFSSTMLLCGATKVRPFPSGLKPISGAAPYSTSRKRPVSS